MKKLILNIAVLICTIGVVHGATVTSTKKLSEFGSTNDLADTDLITLSVNAGSGSESLRGMTYANFLSKIGTGMSFGRTLLVSTNGSDATAVKGRLDKPWRTIQNAVTNAVAGDSLWVLAGAYNVSTNNLLRIGVHYHFEPGSIVTWSNANNVLGDKLGMFDDRATGPTTNYITGSAIFKYHAGYNTSALGMVVETNANSELFFEALQLEGSCQSAVDNSSTYFFNLRHGRSTLNVHKVIDTGTNILGLDEFDQLVTTNSSAIGGIYWEMGQCYANIDYMFINKNYGLWGHQGGAVGTTNDFWYTGHQIFCTNATAAIYLDTTPGVNFLNYRNWFTIKELLNYNGIGISVLGKTKNYFTVQKISGSYAALLSVGINWINTQKMTGRYRALAITSGENYINNLLYESQYDGLGGLGNLIDLSGGVNRLTGGYATVTNLTGTVNILAHSGGTNIIEGMTFDAGTGANTIYPVFVTTNNLHLYNTRIITGASTNSIFATNAQTVTVGNLLVTTNANNNVTFRGGTIITNGFFR
jgi:hypothetical protein